MLAELGPRAAAGLLRRRRPGRPPRPGLAGLAACPADAAPRCAIGRLVTLAAGGRAPSARSSRSSSGTRGLWPATGLERRAARIGGIVEGSRRLEDSGNNCFVDPTMSELPVVRKVRRRGQPAWSVGEGPSADGWRSAECLELPDAIVFKKALQIVDHLRPAGRRDTPGTSGCSRSSPRAARPAAEPTRSRSRRPSRSRRCGPTELAREPFGPGHWSRRREPEDPLLRRRARLLDVRRELRAAARTASGSGSGRSR